ncbi:hypothetical protein OIY81_3462 [Cryptosporidium canis]|nr:hypothetical protein OIY81_3462 [Cryptosporidium canis]
MFRRKAAQTGGETLLGRRATLQLRDRLVKQYGLEPSVAELILGRRKKVDLRITATKFEGSKVQRGVIYRMEFEDASSFAFGSTGPSRQAETTSLPLKGDASGLGPEGGEAVRPGEAYQPNLCNIKDLPATLPWLFEISMDRLFPTMHLLWIHGSLWSIPSLVILRNAKQFIFNGADLMAGGIVFEATRDIASLRKDQIWTIRCVGERLPIAIGVSLVDWDDISEESGRKGKVLQVVHHCKDSLASEGGMDFSEERLALVEAKESEAASMVASRLEGLSLEEGSSGVAGDSKDVQGENCVEPPAAEEGPASENGADRGSSEELSQEVYDLLLETLLLRVASEYSSNKAMLPVDSSAIWDKMSRLCLQTYGIQADIKRSSFVKVQKFFQLFSKRGLLTTKQGRGGALNVVDVNGEEIERIEKSNADSEVALRLPPEVRRRPKQPPQGGTSRPDKAKSTQMEVVLLYQPEQNFSPILEHYCSREAARLGRSLPIRTSRGEKEQTFISIAEARAALEYYINSNGLKVCEADSGQKGRPCSIILDENLENLFQKHLENSQDSDRKTIPISLAYKEIPGFLKVFHYIRNESDSNSDEKPNIFKGPCKTIEIYTESRMGTRKQISVISPFISHFNLDPYEVAESCQKKFASSATVSPIKKYPSSNNLGVIVQGNVVSQLADFLNSRWGIPKSYIQLR